MIAAVEEFAEALHGLFKEFWGRKDFRLDFREQDKYAMLHLGIGRCRGFLRLGLMHKPFIRIQLDILRRDLGPDRFVEQLSELSKVPGFGWVRELTLTRQDIRRNMSLQRLTFTKRYIERIVASEKPDIHTTREGLRKWLIGLSEILPLKYDHHMEPLSK